MLPGTAGKSTSTESWDTPDAVEGDDGSLSAPVMYASLVLGMITVFKSGATSDRTGEGAGRREGEAGPVSIGDGVAGGGSERGEGVWDQRVGDGEGWKRDGILGSEEQRFLSRLIGFVYLYERICNLLWASS